MPSIFLHLFIIIIIIIIIIILISSIQFFVSTLRYGSLSELFFLSF